MPESTIVWTKDVNYVSHPRMSYIKQDENSRCKAMIPKTLDFNFNRPSYGCISKFLTDDGSFMILGDAAQALLDSATKDSYTFFNRTLVSLLDYKEWKELEALYDIKINQYVSGYDGGLYLNLISKEDKYEYVSLEILDCKEKPNVLGMGGGEFDNDDQGHKIGCGVPRASEVHALIKRFKSDLASSRKRLKK